MSFDWETYLYLANELVKRQTRPEIKEASFRSAVSRAYYGAFILARNFLRDIKGITIPRRDTHKFVREKYRFSSNRNEKKIGKDLGALLKKRKDADYEDMATIDIAEATDACNISIQIIYNLNKLAI